MGPKRPRTTSTPESVLKKARYVMTLKEKLEVLDELDSGLRVAEVGRRHKCNESTIRGIRAIADKIRSSVRSATDVSNKVSCVSRRDPLIERMESALAQWMEVQALQKHSDVSYGTVRAKALSLYATLQREEQQKSSTSTTPPPTESSFSASKGWFERFKKRQCLHGVFRHGESGSADTEGAATFKEDFLKYISEEGYVPEQVFNADETGLFYKKVGRKTYVSTEIKKLPGFKGKDMMESAFVFEKVKDERADQQVSSLLQKSRRLDDNRHGDTISLVMIPSEDPLGVHVKEEEEEEETMDVKVETMEEPFDDDSTVSLPPHSKPQAVSASRKTMKKRKSTFSLDTEKEEEMLAFLRENPILWNINRCDYRQKDNRSKLWQGQADIMGIPSEHLRGWFRSLRDKHTRLSKKKSGDGLPNLTEREEWIMEKFAFLVVRHDQPLRPADVEKERTEAVQVEMAPAAAVPSPSPTPSASTPDEPDDNSLLCSLHTRLDASQELVKSFLKPATEEEAFANYLRPTDVEKERTEAVQVEMAPAAAVPSPSPIPSASTLDEPDDNSLLRSLHARLDAYHELVKSFLKPVTEEEVFANYVRDTLVAMPRHKFIKVQKRIAMILFQYMGENEEGRCVCSTPPAVCESSTSGLRPSPAPPGYVPTTSEMHQPPLSQWRHRTPPASTWASMNT